MKKKQIFMRKISIDDKKDLEFISCIHMKMPAQWLDNYRYTEEEVTDNIDEMVQVFQEDRMFCMVVESAGKIASFLWAEINKNQPERLDIMSLWTDPSFRKQGLATLLKDNMELFAVERKIKKISTTVSAANRKMVELNRQLGYKVRCLTMVKEIAEK